MLKFSSHLLIGHLRVEPIDVPLVTNLGRVTLPALQEERRPEGHEDGIEDGGPIVKEVLHLSRVANAVITLDPSYQGCDGLDDPNDYLPRLTPLVPCKNNCKGGETISS